MESQVILEGIVGSTAYGLNHADSDIDIKGIFLLPTSDILSLHPSPDFYDDNPDTSYYELAKFTKLALRCNPTITELLWLDEYIKLTDVGRQLVKIREAFLSTKEVRARYSGYAMAQMERLQKRGDFGSDLKKRREKHARHCFRLLLQCEQLLTTGSLTVKLTKDQIVDIRNVSQLEDDAMNEAFKSADDIIKAANSVLPDKPNEDLINEVLLDIRKFNW